MNRTETNKCVILKEAKNIAIVGISRNPNRISREIASYLRYHGYNVVGVNPNKNFNDADGIIIFNSLKEIPHKIHIVNVFRKSEDIPEIIENVLAIKPDTLWLQLGIRNDDAVKPILENGINIIQDSCIKIDHSICL